MEKVELVAIPEVRIIGVTEKAVQVACSDFLNGTMWFPQSCISVRFQTETGYEDYEPGLEGTLHVHKWFYDKKVE